MNSRAELSVLRLCSGLLILLIGFLLLKQPALYEVIDSYCLWLAKICQLLLSLFSEQIFLTDNVLRYTENGSGVTIGKECSGLDFILVGCSAMIAFGENQYKSLVLLLAVLMGVFIFNILRLLLLFTTNVFSTNYFNFVHELVGPYLLVVSTSLILLLALERFKTSQNLSPFPHSKAAKALPLIKLLLFPIICFALFHLLNELGIVSAGIKLSGLIAELIYDSHQLTFYQAPAKSWYAESSFFMARIPYTAGIDATAINVPPSKLSFGNLNMLVFGCASYLVLLAYRFSATPKQLNLKKLLIDMAIILFITILSIVVRVVYYYLDMMDVEKGYPRALSETSSIIVPYVLSESGLMLLKAFNDTATYSVLVTLPLFLVLTRLSKLGLVQGKSILISSKK